VSTNSQETAFVSYKN